MNKTTCCVCFKGNADIPLAASDSNKETITSKLRKVVSEVPWKDTFTICPQCLKTLDVVLEFRNACIRSSSIRLEQEESGRKSQFSIKEDESSSSGEEIDKITEDSSEQTIAVTCEICKIDLNSHEHLYKHNKDLHHSQQQYKNDLLCVDLVGNKKKNESCHVCNESFSSESDLKYHIKKHDVFICFHCNKIFKSKVLLAKHIKVKHEQGKEFESSNNEETIIDNADNSQSDDNSNSRKNKLYQCSKCEKSYKMEKIMLNHMVTCDGVKRHSKINFTKDFSKNECAKCGRFYTTEKILKAHMKQCRYKSPLQEYKCYLCDDVLKSPEDKFVHVLEKHNINLKLDNTCQYCYKQFLSDENLQFHLKELHGNEINSKKAKSCSERSYSCEVCSKIFGYVKEVIKHCVEDHQMDGKSVKPYLCSICNTRFTSSPNLIQHKQYHEGERSHICSYCGKSFITKSDLTVHEYTHLNRRNYKCEICERAFNTNKNLRSHMLVVHTDSSFWKYQCHLCSKKFPLKSGYDQHQRRHSGDKRFKCLVCEKSFISSSELRKHKMFHSNERAFKCSHCGKDYKDRRVYEVHLTKVHGIGNAKIPVRVKKFACNICPGTFFDKQKLSRHMCTHTVMASTTIYTIEHILEEKSTKKDRDSRKKSSLKKGKGKKKVKHVKVAESEPPPEEVKLEEEDSGNLEEILKEIDAKLDKHHELERCMQRLKKLRIKYPEDPQLLWRIGKAYQKMAEKEKNVQTKLSHVEKGIEHCQKSMDMDNKQADAHKWFAILIGYKGQYQSTREKIACGKQFKKHLDIALFLNPSDPVLQHMAGRFCLEIVSLPWVERKIAKSMFTDPINCSIDIAMDHFLQAEKFMGQGEWKENRMLIAKCHILREDYKKALEWLDKAKHANDDSAGETINKEIDELLKKYSKYR